jgi:hypothetical protein
MEEAGCLVMSVPVTTHCLDICRFCPTSQVSPGVVSGTWVDTEQCKNLHTQISVYISLHVGHMLSSCKA